MKTKFRYDSTGKPGSVNKRRLWSPGLCTSIALAGLLSSPSTFAIDRESFCTRTSNVAWLACKFDARDDFWINWGNCVNLGAAPDRTECWAEGKDGRTENEELCGEQYDGRTEVCELIGEDRYDPEYEPEDFVDPADIGGDVAANPLFPLIPGSMWVYEAGDEVITVTVSGDTREIDGVLCTAVQDTVTEDGVPTEDTTDWYAQDHDGNVWYFGETSLNYEDGQLENLDGSWLAGTDGGKAGILMPAAPMVDDVYRQEFFLGDAEDMARVIDLAATPELGEDNLADCDGGCLQTREWSPIEPGHFEFKYYQAGIGMVQEIDPDSGETVELIEFLVP